MGVRDYEGAGGTRYNRDVIRFRKKRSSGFGAAFNRCRVACSREQLDPNAVRIRDVCPPARCRLHVEGDGVPRSLGFRERLLKVLDLEREVVEPSPTAYSVAKRLPFS